MRRPPSLDIPSELTWHRGRITHWLIAAQDKMCNTGCNVMPSCDHITHIYSQFINIPYVMTRREKYIRRIVSVHVTSPTDCLITFTQWHHTSALSVSHNLSSHMTSTTDWRASGHVVRNKVDQRSEWLHIERCAHHYQQITPAKVSLRKRAESHRQVLKCVMWCDVMWCDVMWCDVMWCNIQYVLHK